MIEEMLIHIVIPLILKNLNPSFYKKKKRKDFSSGINILEHNVQQDYLEAIRLIRTRVIRRIEKNNHKALLYGSKYYLEEIFQDIDFPVWLAHYTENTDYSGEYKVWQICSNGKVNGIDDNLVDIDIMKNN